MQVRPAGLSLFFTIIVLLLTAAQLAGLTLRFGFGHSFVHGLVPLFDFDRENNIPSLYSAISLLVCSGLLALLASESRQARRREVWHWRGLSLLFLLVAIDEQFALHERLILPVQGALQTSGYLYFAWVIPYGLLVVGLGILYLRFFFGLPIRQRFQFALAAILYLGGALGLEMAGGAYYERIGGIPDLPYALLVTVEELLEMAGVIVFIHALLSLMAHRQLQIRILPDLAASRRLSTAETRGAAPRGT